MSMVIIGSVDHNTLPELVLFPPWLFGIYGYLRLNLIPVNSLLPGLSIRPRGTQPLNHLKAIIPQSGDYGPF